MQIFSTQPHVLRAASLAVFALAATLAVSGCSGGGATSGSTSGGQTQTVTVTGIIADSSTKFAAANRTVHVVGGSAADSVTDVNGQFTLANIPLGTHTITVTDSAGQSDGSANIQVTSSNTNLGTIFVDISNLPPPPP